MSEGNYQWENGGAYPAAGFCSNQGGKLPLVNGDPSQSMAEVWGSTASIASIEGIGIVDTDNWSTPWSITGLPVGDFWTGTEVTDHSGNSWVVHDYGGVGVGGSDQSDSNRVVCVP